MTDQIPLPHGGEDTWTTDLDPAELAKRVDACHDDDDAAKGARLEDLACWLLAHLQGFRVMSRDVFSEDGSQEVDLVVYNDPSGSAIAALGARIIVECKNRSGKAGSQEIAWLYWKARLKAANSAILVTAAGVTGPNSYRNGRAVLDRANADGTPILVVMLTEIAALTSTEDLRDLLVRRFMDLVAD